MRRLACLVLALALGVASPARADDAAFAPNGSTVLVDTTPRQVISGSSLQNSTTYRVRNLGAAQAYFTWITPSLAGGTGAPSGLSATAPAAGTPAPNVIGMLPSSVETFTLPVNAWFQAGVGFTFEVTPGTGR